MNAKLDGNHFLFIDELRDRLTIINAT